MAPILFNNQEVKIQLDEFTYIYIILRMYDVFLWISYEEERMNNLSSNINILDISPEYYLFWIWVFFTCQPNCVLVDNNLASKQIIIYICMASIFAHSNNSHICYSHGLFPYFSIMLAHRKALITFSSHQLTCQQISCDIAHMWSNSDEHWMVVISALWRRVYL